MNKSIRKVMSLVLAAVLCLGMMPAVLLPVSAEAAEPEEGVIYSQDFEAPLSESDPLYGVVEVSGGTAKASTFNNGITIPPEYRTASNNYELSFDVKQASEGAFFFIHFAGLNGNTGENIYMACEGNGAYWSMADFNGHMIYNNSGNLHGGLNANPVDITDNFAHVRIVKFGGYMELWVNGTRLCVSHLSNFGNNNYHTRAEIAEGTITGFWIDPRGTIEIDNVVLKEPKGLSTVYSETNPTTDSGEKIFDLSAENLYRDNFMVRGTFVIRDDAVTGYYPTIKLAGMNASLTSRNGREYCINVQSSVDEGVLFNPGIFWQTEEEAWKSAGAAAPVGPFKAGDEVEYLIEVWGDHLDLYINGTKVIATTFTEMGITRGHLQYLWIQSGNGAYWRDFAYEGFESTSAARVSVPSDNVVIGDDIVASAYVFGDRAGETFTWYVNGEVQTETGTTLTLPDVAEGTYTIEYRGTGIRSNTVTVTATAGKITLSADKTEFYPTDSVTLTAEGLGAFRPEDPFEWYINGTRKDGEGGETLSLSGLAAGTYTVVVKRGSVESNAVTLTVNAGFVRVTTEKNSYFKGEQATFTAEVTGFGPDVALQWYVNGEALEGKTGNSLTLSLSDYAKAGESVLVTCKAGETVSNEVLVSLVYNMKEELESGEHWKVIYRDEIKEGNTYGNFTVGSDADGSYLYSTTPGQMWYIMSGAKAPSSTSFSMSYQLFVPDDIEIEYYSYPCMKGLNSRKPDAYVELAVAVNAEGFRPYIKDQSTGKEWSVGDYGFGKDLTYAGLAKKGDWNTLEIMSDGTNIAMYLNGEIVLFTKFPNLTVPTEFNYNFFPSDGTGTVPLRIKGMTISSVELPAPDVSGVTLSLSSLTAKIGEKVTVNANLSPFNALAKEIKWFVGGKEVASGALKYEFSATEAGEYEIYCVIDGVTSATKTITVKADTDQKPGEQPDNEGGAPVWLPWVIVAAVVVIIAAVAIPLVLKKKKH